MEINSKLYCGSARFVKNVESRPIPPLDQPSYPRNKLRIPNNKRTTRTKRAHKVEDVNGWQVRGLTLEGAWRSDPPCVQERWVIGPAFAIRLDGRRPDAALKDHAGQEGLENVATPSIGVEPDQCRLIPISVWRGGVQHQNTAATKGISPNRYDLFGSLRTLWKRIAGTDCPMSLRRGRQEKTPTVNGFKTLIVRATLYLLTDCFYYILSGRTQRPPEMTASQHRFRIPGTAT